MKARKTRITLFSLAVVGAFAGLIAPPRLEAQEFEINPYAGGFLTSAVGPGGSFKSEGIYGVRGGGFLIDTVSLEANAGYIRHFEFEKTDPRSSALLWELNGLYHFYPETTSRIALFVTAGAGGLTALVEDGQSPVRYRLGSGTAQRLFGSTSPIAGGEIVSLDDRDTFLTFNYGGGIKATRLWGPLGLRFDVRGRTLPNLFAHAPTFLETTGGLTFNWGER